MISLEDLAFSYGRRSVLSGLDLTVAPGDILALEGGNGAGKSTLLRLACGALRPARGRIRVDGIDLLRSPRRARERIGFLGEGAPLPRDLTARAYLCHRARLKG